MNMSAPSKLAAVAALLCALLGNTAWAQDDLAEATRLSQSAAQSYGQGRFAQAIESTQQALAIREKALGPEHPDTAASLNNLAFLYGATGQYGQALPLYQRALAIVERTLGPEHPDVATTLNNLAALYQATGRYPQALPLLQRTQAIREKVFGPEHPDTAGSLNNLAALYQATGRFEQALPLFQRALTINEKALGPTHAGTATSLNNLAGLYRSTGQYALALPLVQRALAITERALGPEHPDTATRLNNVAELYRSTDQYGLALPLFQRALAITEKALGPDHPNMIASLSNLATLYQTIGQHDRALPLFERALAISEKRFGPAHPMTAATLNNLASAHEATGQHAKALVLYQYALAVLEKNLGPEHPDAAASLNNLAGVHEAMGQHAQALPLYERALAINEKALGPLHPGTATSLNNLAALFRAIGRYDRALALYQRSLLILQSANAPRLLWAVNGNLMAVYAPEQPSADRVDNVQLAIWHGKQAINALQSVRAGLRSLDDDTQRSFLKSNERYYSRLSELLVQQGRIPEAEQVLAMLKEKELSDLLQRSEVRKTQADDVGVERTVSRQNAELAERGARYASELAALERKDKLEPLTADEKARRAELQSAAERWREDYRRWLGGLATLFSQEGRSRQEAQAQGKQGTQLQAIVAADPGAVGLHYIVTDQRIAIIVATANGSFGRFSEVRREDLNRQIAALRQAIVGRSDPLPAAQALHKTLIEPVAEDLEEAKATTLVLSLTDTLRYVPFAALHDGKSFLIERHPLALYASAGGARPQASSAPWQVAALGLTQSRLGYNALPAVRGELEGIVRSDASPQGVLPGRISLDQAFDKGQLEEALKGRYSVVHVASHFSFTPGDESRSVLLPGAGEPISLGQLAVLDFRQVQQLTLSACETATGGGADENGAEVEGLAAAVQDRGAQAVLASLWKVADASTAQLMQRFYAQRAQGQTVSRAIALQQAQIALLRGAAKELAQAPSAERSARRDGPAGTATAAAPVDASRPYAHPFYWAPFVLSGNWL